MGRSRNSVVFVAIAMRINQVFCGLRRLFCVELPLGMATKKQRAWYYSRFFSAARPVCASPDLPPSRHIGGAKLKAAAFLLPRKCASKKSCFFLASCVCLCVVMQKPFALGITGT